MNPDWIANLAVLLTLTLAVGWLVNGMIRTRHRHPQVGAEGLEAKRQVELLSNENTGLKGQVGRLEQRIAVLERIATDPAERTAREIESLR